MKRIIYIFWVAAATIACSPNSKADVTATLDLNELVSQNYIGNGVQWDPYQMDYGHGRLTMTQEDIDKVYRRLDYMRPAFIRLMLGTWGVIDPKTKSFDPLRGLDNVKLILDYCQSRNVTVLFGDWGHGLAYAKSNTIDSLALRCAAEYVDFLVNKQGYTCIKYINMVNEPNGYWSSTDNNYELWQRVIRYFYSQIVARDLQSKVSLVGPDAAVWTDKETSWIKNCADSLGSVIGLYDIHTYPSKTTVNSGAYSAMIKAYYDQVPKGKQMVMGEIGLKYGAAEPCDSLLQRENVRRAEASPYASVEDSQMFVFDHMYGTDIADALFQTINCGFSGCVAWMLDDAMHGNEKRWTLKTWGFWNIFGDEFFGSEAEKIRPWYYSWSLLCRYMPQGSNCYRVNLDGNTENIKAIAVEKEGKYMVALLNSGTETKSVLLESKSLPVIKDAKQFIYGEGKILLENETTVIPNKGQHTVNLRRGEMVEMPSQTMVMYTNFEF